MSIKKILSCGLLTLSFYYDIINIITKIITAFSLINKF